MLAHPQRQLKSIQVSNLEISKAKSGLLKLRNLLATSGDFTQALANLNEAEGCSVGEQLDINLQSRKLDEAPTIVERCHGVERMLTSTSGLVEITQIGWTRAKTLVSTEMAVFGVCLGDRKEQVLMKLNRAGFDDVREHSGCGPLECDVHDLGELVLSVSMRNDTVQIIRLHAGMRNYLQAEAEGLFDVNTATDAGSQTRRALLGFEDDLRFTDTDAGAFYWDYRYYARGLRLVRQKDGNGERAYLMIVPPGRIEL